MHAGRRDGAWPWTPRSSAEAGPGGMPIPRVTYSRPVDILRRQDGHDVLLPVCTERLEDFLHRRAGGAELAVGRGRHAGGQPAPRNRGAVGDGSGGARRLVADRGGATGRGDRHRHRTAGRADGSAPSIGRCRGAEPRAHPGGSGRGADRPPPTRARARARRSGDLRGRRSARAGHDHIRPQARPSSHAPQTPRWIRPNQTRSRRRGCTPCHAISMRNGRIFSRGPRPGSGVLCARRAPDAGRPWLVAGGLAGVVLDRRAAVAHRRRGTGDGRVCRQTRRPHRPRARHPLRPSPSSDPTRRGRHRTRPGRDRRRTAQRTDRRAPQIRPVSSRSSRSSMLRSPAASSIWLPRIAP